MSLSLSRLSSRALFARSASRARASTSSFRAFRAFSRSSTRAAAWDAAWAATSAAASVDTRVATEAATAAELDSAVSQKKPIVMYWWTPTAAAGKYHLVQVKLPEYTAGCADDLTTVACDYPADPLIKLASAKLQAKNAKVWAMVQKVTITNDQQLELLPKVEIEQQEASKVAADWIAANEAVWSTWFS